MLTSSFSLNFPPKREAICGDGVKGGHSRPVRGGHFGVPFPKLWDPLEAEGHSGLAGQG